MRQGDVILIPATNSEPDLEQFKASHLTLAEGEVTGHRHRITDGDAELYEKGSTLFLRVHSETATLGHEEHAAIQIPKGFWKVQIQREYVPSVARRSPANSWHSSWTDGDSAARWRRVID